MPNQNKPLNIKILGVIFAAINLISISLGLISCSNEIQNPLNRTEQQNERYKNQSNEESESEQENDDDDDDDEKKNRKDKKEDDDDD
jgi:sortase (surface protein transpeptidase)